jgi:hypothetical protein
MRILTNSRLKTARSCQREHLFRYELGYRPVEDAHALRFGSLVHLGLEALFLAVMAGLPVQAWLEAALAAVQAEADLFDRVKAEEILRGYFYRWKDEPYEVLAVEAKFELPLINPATGAPSRTWRLSGKLDLVVRDLRDGLVRIMEHKTSSEDVTPGSIYWKRLRMDGQVSVYYDGAASLGHEVTGCVYDVLAKPGIRPLKATPQGSRKYKANGELYANQREQDETPEEFRIRLVEAISENPAAYYQRGDVVRLESEMEEARFDSWQTAQQIQEALRLGRSPRNPDACVRFGRTCPFFAVCAGDAQLEDESLFPRLDDVHPELSEPSEKREQSQEAAP